MADLATTYNNQLLNGVNSYNDQQDYWANMAGNNTASDPGNLSGVLPASNSGAITSYNGGNSGAIGSYTPYTSNASAADSLTGSINSVSNQLSSLMVGNPSGGVMPKPGAEAQVAALQQQLNSLQSQKAQLISGGADALQSFNDQNYQQYMAQSQSGGTFSTVPNNNGTTSTGGLLSTSNPTGTSSGVATSGNSELEDYLNFYSSNGGAPGGSSSGSAGGGGGGGDSAGSGSNANAAQAGSAAATSLGTNGTVRAPTAGAYTSAANQGNAILDAGMNQVQGYLGGGIDANNAAQQAALNDLQNSTNAGLSAYGANIGMATNALNQGQTNAQAALDSTYRPVLDAYGNIVQQAPQDMQNYRDTVNNMYTDQSLNDYMNSNAVQYALQQQQQNTMRQAAAQGIARTGGIAKALNQDAANYLSGTYQQAIQNRINAQQGLANTSAGLLNSYGTAAGNYGNASSANAMGTAQNLGNLYATAASGVLGANQALGQSKANVRNNTSGYNSQLYSGLGDAAASLASAKANNTSQGILGAGTKNIVIN